VLEAVEVFRVAALPVGREVRRLDAVAPGVVYEGEQAVDIAALIEILSNWDGNFYKMIAQDPCRSVGERRTPAIAPVAGPRSDSRCPSSAEASERPAQRVVSILTCFSPSPDSVLTWVPHDVHVPIGDPPADRDTTTTSATAVRTRRQR